MNTPKFTVIATYATLQNANKAAYEKGFNSWEAVFHCENGMNGYEIRIYDDWKEWQPDLYIFTKETI